ncbi:hypothetical protein D3C80_1905920 [compost metagenome]
MELTEPFEAPVVWAAQATEDGTPKRTSLPSIFPTDVSTLAAMAAGAGWVSMT